MRLGLQHSGLFKEKLAAAQMSHRLATAPGSVRRHRQDADFGSKEGPQDNEGLHKTISVEEGDRLVTRSAKRLLAVTPNFPMHARPFGSRAE
jgi:hypothetical protein